MFFEVFDKDKVGKDNRLGYASVGWGSWAALPSCGTSIFSTFVFVKSRHSNLCELGVAWCMFMRFLDVSASV